MEVLYADCAGLDVHKDSVVACARHTIDGNVSREVRTFKTTTADLMALSAWLSAQGCTHIVMEATGVYWKPVWHILSDGEFELALANAAHVKNVPGRKTDVNDAAWLADLMAHGLIRGSFVPEEQTQEMRNVLRMRKQFVRERSSHIQRLQKTLEDANIKLDSVITDITGLSGRRMIEALIGGETDPQALAALAHRRIKATSAELEAALRGRVTKHHRFALRLLLQHIDAIDAAIAEIDQEVDANIEPFRTAITILKHDPRRQPTQRRGHRRRDRRRHGAVPDRRPSDLLGRTLSQERRERRQAPVHPHAKGGALAEDHPDPMRLGGDANEGNLLAGPVPPPARPSRRQESHRCGRRFHPHRRLSHAQERRPLPRSGRRSLRPPRQNRPNQPPHRQTPEPRLCRPDHTGRSLNKGLFLVRPRLRSQSPTSMGEAAIRSG